YTHRSSSACPRVIPALSPGLSPWLSTAARQTFLSRNSCDPASNTHRIRPMDGPITPAEPSRRRRPKQQGHCMTQIYRLLAAASMFLTATAFAQLPQQVGDTPLPSLAPIVKQTSPAVVNIATRGTVRQARARNPLLEDPFFRR